MKVIKVQMKDRPRRTWFDRLVMTAPGVYLSLIAPLMRLPAGSRLRTAFVRSVLDRGYAALNRQDLEYVQISYRPDAALNFPDDVGVDFEDRYEGRELAFAMYRRWLDEWGFVWREPVGFVDRGDVIVVLAHEQVRGAGSGLTVERELGAVFRLDGFAVAEQWEFFNWDQALAH